MKTIKRIIDFSASDILLAEPLPETLEIQDFKIEIANSDHFLYVNEICEVTLSSAIARGTGISGRSPEYLIEKMKNNEAIIAFSSDGKWAGFSFISSWDNGKSVSNSGLIVAPEFRHTGLAKTSKRKFLN